MWYHMLKDISKETFMNLIDSHVHIGQFGQWAFKSETLIDYIIVGDYSLVWRHLKRLEINSSSLSSLNLLFV